MEKTYSAKPNKKNSRNINDIEIYEVDFSKHQDNQFYINHAEERIIKTSEHINDNKKIHSKKPASASLDFKELTTTQMRNIYNRFIPIYHQVLSTPSKDDQLPEGIKEKLGMFRYQLVYQCGRIDDVNIFCKVCGVLNGLDHINNSKKNFMHYMHYMEALVAYHYYYTNKKDK
ncbi:type III-A CRISPR-associated protein Csm2 [Massilioclostridium coli]|uniref:type III-A CRISPR-associated protein Csm2 n=1 Tax=Massilioclostridium coli TaxID=1870991 RepID=UPI00085BD847|nr:type III-A CRISPR-associated protein Csm2 [Massilioclostridium coli]